MRHFWTTAAAVALCALSTPTWAQSETTTHHRHHHKAHASSSSGTHHKSSRRSKKAKAEASTSRHHHKGRHARHEEAPLEDSSSAPSSSGRHHHRRGRHAAAEETRAESRHGRHGRHAAESAIHTEGGGSVKVRRHETFADVADKAGVSEAELARLNHLHKPYHVKSGQHLKLPSRRYYTVKSGDTLYSLSKRFGVEESELKSLNHVSKRHSIKAGQKLYLPGGAEDAEAARASEEERQRSESTNVAPRRRYNPPPVGPQPYAPGVVNPRPSAMPPAAGERENGFQLTPQTQAPAARPAPPPVSTGPLLPQSGPAPSAGDVVAAGRGKFLWPASGTLLAGFGPRAGGQRNDGVNIAGNIGDPVRAAADGEVVYAGDQVPSFGNLVLVKHAGGWVTAYAYMSKILVKNRDHVSQGEQIGVIGQSGSADRPQLHFEIRFAPSPKDKATPVDPMLLLPAR